MKRLIITCLVMAITTGAAGAVHAQETASVEQAPNFEVDADQADGQNQCFARVSVPAQYRTEDVETEVLPEVTRFRITPPEFKDGSETVTVKPAFSKFTAVQPVMEETTQKFEVMPASTMWVRDSLQGKRPLTKGELLDMEDLGVEVDNVSVGTCYFEHFVEATLEDIPTKIMISEASEKLSVVDEVLEDDVVTVTTAPAFTRIVEVPPTLKKSEERVLTAAASKRWETE